MPMLLTAFLFVHAVQAAPARPSVAPEPVCVRAGDLPRAFAGWNTAASTTLSVGKPFVLRAMPPGKIRWGVPARKPGNGAVASFTIATAGAYRIGLSNGAWIDVVLGGKALRSTAHGHGPLCTGLRKVVDFTLTRGTYALQLSAMPEAETRVMVVAK